METLSSPMDSGGIDTDIITGLPVIHKISKERERREKRVKADALQGTSLELEMSNPQSPSSIAVREMARMLDLRIEQLVKSDPQAMVMVEFLNRLGLKIRVGRAATKQLLETNFGDVAPIWDTGT